MELLCHPLLAAQDWCQHQPDSSQMKLNRKMPSRDLFAMLQQTKGVHCLGPTRASPEKTLKWIQCGHESSAAFFFHSTDLFLLKLLAFTDVAFGCQEFLNPSVQFKGKPQSSVCLSGGFQRHLPSPCIGEGSHHHVRIGCTRSLQQGCRRGA